MAETDAERRPWSVRVRILASILLVAVVGLAVAGGTAYFAQRAQILTDIDDHLLDRVQAARAVATGENPVADEDEGDAVPATGGVGALTTTRATLDAVLSRIVPGPHESALGLVDGRATYIPGVPIDYHLEDDPGLIARIDQESASGQVVIGTTLSPLGHLRYVAVPITVEGDAERGVFVTTVDIDAELADLNAAFRTYALVAFVSAVALGLVGWFVAGRLLRPLRDLREAASRITASDSDERIPVRGRDDVSELTRTVNRMLDRLSGALRGQRQLLDDVRHELKTPITIVRGHLELLDPDDPADVESVRSLSIDELDRMTGLVDDIELLAEVQHDVVRPAPTDVAALTAGVAAKASVIPGRTWTLVESATVTVLLDAARITQAWLQLVDNAAKYSPDGSEVRLGSTRRDDTIELWVADEGAGIPDEAEDRIFERFGRVDSGRGIRGSGLGLPIVKAIVEAHGGRVSLASSTAGSRFALVLPLRRPAEPPDSGPAADGVNAPAQQEATA